MQKGKVTAVVIRRWRNGRPIKRWSGCVKVDVSVLVSRGDFVEFAEDRHIWRIVVRGKVLDYMGYDGKWSK